MNPVMMLLKGFGIEIDPDELVRTVQAMANSIAEMEASQKRTEATVARLEAALDFKMKPSPQ